MNAPFRPANGLVGRAKQLVPLVSGLEPGDGITYTEVMDLFGCDRSAAQQAMLQAKKLLEEAGQNTVVNRRGFGWDVISAKGNIGVINQRHKKATRAFAQECRIINSTNMRRSELSQTDRAELDHYQRSAAARAAAERNKPKSVAELLKMTKEQPALPLRSA